jgi:hypothetical protein
MSQAADPFVGAWKLNLERSTFDANHNPQSGTMRFEAEDEDRILMTAEGISEKGERFSERPVQFTPDGRDHPVPGFPGLVVKTTLPSPGTIQTECRRQDGSIVGQGTYAVSADGRSLIAKTSGWDSQLRQFEVTTVWDRQ